MKIDYTDICKYCGHHNRGTKQVFCWLCEKCLDKPHDCDCKE